MELRTIKKLSKFLSLVLRHRPEVIGLKLSPQGWANTKELLEKCQAQGKKIDFNTLKVIVEQNDKQRFAFNEDFSQIRASQGHSISIDLGYTAQEPPEILYHGTATRFLGSIYAQGLIKGKRHHVHLSANKDTALQVGQRHGKPVILEVAAKAMADTGHAFYLSENGVWLTDHVPPQFLSERSFELNPNRG